MMPSLEELVRWAATAADERGIDAACELFSSHFSTAIRAGDSFTAIRTLQLQGLFFADRSHFEEAEELVWCALEMARAWENPRLVARQTNLLGYLSYRRLQWSAAREWYLEALRLARMDHDDELVAGICLNLGIIENIQGRFREARLFYLESIGSGVRCGHRGSLVMTYNNLGMVCTDQEDWLEALVYFDRGMEIASELGDARLLAMLHANRAEPLIQLGETTQVTDSLATAERLARESDFRAILPDVERFRAKLARRDRDYLAAENHIDRALLASATPDLQLHWAEVVEERGRLRADTGKLELALADFTSARQVYLALAAENDVARVDRCIAEVACALAGGDAAD